MWAFEIYVRRGEGEGGLKIRRKTKRGGGQKEGIWVFAP